MTWCLFGGHGWIGTQFRRILDERNVDYVVPDFRMDDLEAVALYLKTQRPHRVISFIGRTHAPPLYRQQHPDIHDTRISTIDYLELGRPQLRENIRDNLFAPVGVAILCREMGIHFTYLGTGCIFQYTEEDWVYLNGSGGDPPKRVTEDSNPNFFGSSYSIVKGYTDQLMRLLSMTVLNLRIRMPITKDLTNSRNFIHKILKYDKICSVQNSMTVLDDVLPIVFKMVRHKTVGTYNMCNPGTISHNEILDMYTRYIDPDFTYENFTTEEMGKILAADRSNNHLDTTKLERDYTIPEIHASLERLFQSIAKDRASFSPVVAWVKSVAQHYLST